MRVATERKILNKVLSIPLEFGPTVACEHVGRIRRNRIWILICHVRLHLWNVITRLSFVNELSTDYIFSTARSHIRNNKSFKNVFFEERPYNYIRSVISTSRARRSRKIFISFTIDACSLIKHFCYECVNTSC